MNNPLEKILSVSPSGAHWAKIGILPHHGIDLPLSALHSKNSCGIGEFYDLIPMIDWCARIKMDVIQLLPLNDSGNDPSPYNALSSCALNPVYLSLHKLPYIEEFPDLQKKIVSMKKLTQSQKIPYHEVKIQKLYWLRLYFNLTGTRLIKEAKFQEFMARNQEWAVSYALFKVLKDILEQSLWTYWPDELKYLSKKQYDELVEIYWPEICFHISLQYLAFEQMMAISSHARQSHILLKGDIPILISPDSVDVWRHPELFDMSLAAGAPPDHFSKNQQQYWGFPLFRWDEMRKSKYGWWKQRLAVSSQFFDLYRLDHVVGLFRIWGIPLGQPTTMGRFIPEDESLWIPQGKELLNMMLSSFSMLPIAEDLGQIPLAVRETLQQLGIPGTKVMRWERYWNEDKRFIPYSEYPPLSMTSVSTHDTETLTLWWKNLPEEARAFATFKGWHYQPELSKEQRKEILWDGNHTPSLFHVNLLQEYFALFSDLVWTKPEDERINVPGKMLPSNWTYRFRPSLEEIVEHEGLQKEIAEILLGSGTAAKSA